jgi:acetoacetyl-CoA reductase/3-oxoacyl-[acyl-carrier protein] reductase
VPPLEPLDFTGQTAWVTGAGRGIGLACAQAFHERGATVVGMDLSITPELAEVAQHTVELDISDAPSVKRHADALMEAGIVPDVLVNNAGITRDGMVWKLSAEDWTRVLDINLSGAFYLTQQVFPAMREKGAGSIVNITSINGERGKLGQSNYAAAKAGLIGFTKTCAREGGRFGIRVNAVAPGMVETEMAKALPAEVKQRAIDESALGCLAQPADVANCVLFLASPLARHITGQVIRVDGGQYI